MIESKQNSLKGKRVILKKLKIVIYTAIPLLGLYPEKILIQKETPTPLFTAEWFTIAKTWKCPSTDKWIKKMWDIYLLSHKKEWNNVICSNMDGPRDYHTKWSQSKTNTTWYHLYVESKIGYVGIYLQNRHTDKENKLMVAKGRRG